MFLPFKPDHVTAFDGKIQFDYLYLSIVAIFIIHFAYIQYRQYKLTYFKVDFWGYVIFIKVLVPLFVMYPFSLSLNNYMSIDVGINEAIPFIEIVLTISFIGYISIYLGRYIYDVYYKKSKTYIIESIFENNLKSESILELLKYLTLILMFFLISIQFSESQLFNGRNYFQENIKFRPIFNLTLTFFNITVITHYLFYLQTNKTKYIYILFLFLLLGLTFGSRGALLDPILTCYLFYLFKNYKRLRFKSILMVLVVICVSAVALLALRENKDSLSNDDVLSEILYGNSFSDSRDFAFILSHWELDYLYGKSYFASFISFLPKFASEIRQEWSFSHITNQLIGFEDDHPGMRLGTFGEVFMNFGYWGVISLGILFGFILRHMDKNIKNAYIYFNDPQKAFSKTILLSFITGLTITASFSAFYATLIITFLCFGFRKFLLNQHN